MSKDYENDGQGSGWILRAQLIYIYFKCTVNSDWWNLQILDYDWIWLHSNCKYMIH